MEELRCGGSGVLYDLSCTCIIGLLPSSDLCFLDRAGFRFWLRLSGAAQRSSYSFLGHRPESRKRVGKQAWLEQGHREKKNVHPSLI